MHTIRDRLRDTVRRLEKLIADILSFIWLIKPLSKILDWIVPDHHKQRWAQLSSNKRYFLTSIILGLISVILSPILTNLGLQAAGENIQDWVIKMDIGTHHTLSATSDKPEYLFAFVDINEWTYCEWGEPLFTPREKLASLIETVVAAQPSLVIVDIELDRPNRDAPTHDLKLKETLARLPGETPIILVKSMRRSSKPGELPTPRQSFLDKTVAESDRLYWGFPIFLRDTNHSIRRWEIAECAIQDNKPTLIPSVPLLAYALLSQSSKGNLLEELTQQLQEVKNDCSRTTESIGKSFDLGGQSFSLDGKGQENRIIYSMKQGMVPQMIQSGAEERPLFITLPAQSILSGNTTTYLENTLHDRIVIIGGSFTDSFDIHETPAGSMPGSVIILNSLRSLFTYGAKHTPPWPIRTLFTATLTIIIAYCFLLCFAIEGGRYLSWLFLIIVILPLNFFAYHKGIFLDLVIPPVLISVYTCWQKLWKKHTENNVHDNEERRQ